MTIFDSKRDVRRDVKPQYIKLWLPCGILAVIGTLIKSEFIFPLLVIGAWALAAGMTSELIKSWEQVRDDKLYADVADQDKFIQFTLSGNLVTHIAFECGVIAVATILCSLIFNHTGIGSVGFIGAALFFLILTVSQYYFFMVGRAIFRDVEGKNHYPDGSDYIPGVTFVEAYKQYRQEQEESARQWQENQAKKAAEEARKAEQKKRADEELQKAREASEAARAARIAEYERDKGPGRKKVWEWLNIGWNLDFPDEVCDIIADYTHGRTEGITGRRIKMLLSGVVPDNEAAQYARKFDSMNFAVRKPVSYTHLTLPTIA